MTMEGKKKTVLREGGIIGIIVVIMSALCGSGLFD